MDSIDSIYYIAPPQGASIRMTNVTIFINGMYLKVQQGTVLIFNPMSSSQEHLAQMRDVQFHVGGITFQTKAEVAAALPYTFFKGQIHFPSVTPDQYTLEEVTGGLEFYPLIFDYLRRKFDDRSALLLRSTQDLSFAQFQRFQDVCNYLLPGLLSEEQEQHAVDTNQRAELLASKELMHSNDGAQFLQAVETAIDADDADAFRDLLLHKVNRLALGTLLSSIPVEQHLLLRICEVQLTPARVRMLTTLFHPKEFGGRFFFDAQGQSTVFTELIRISTLSSSTTSVHQRFMDFQEMVHHLVINLGMPIHITDKLFQINRRDKPSALLDLAKQYRAWIAFVAYAPYFSELEPTTTTSTTTNGVHPYNLISGHFLDFAFHPQDLLHADWPVCVQQLLPYISDDKLKMAEGQLMQTLTRRLSTNVDDLCCSCNDSCLRNPKDVTKR